MFKIQNFVSLITELVIFSFQFEYWNAFIWFVCKRCLQWASIWCSVFVGFTLFAFRIRFVICCPFHCNMRRCAYVSVWIAHYIVRLAVVWASTHTHIYMHTHHVWTYNHWLCVWVQYSFFFPLCFHPNPKQQTFNGIEILVRLLLFPLLMQCV